MSVQTQKETVRPLLRLQLSGDFFQFPDATSFTFILQLAMTEVYEETSLKGALSRILADF